MPERGEVKALHGMAVCVCVCVCVSSECVCVCAGCLPKGFGGRSGVRFRISEVQVLYCFGVFEFVPPSLVCSGLVFGFGFHDWGPSLKPHAPKR